MPCPRDAGTAGDFRREILACRGACVAGGSAGVAVDVVAVGDAAACLALAIPYKNARTTKYDDGLSLQ